MSFLVISDYDELFTSLYDGSIDFIGSVWCPDGHKTYLDGHTLGEDYIIVGTTSDKGVFFWMTTPAAYDSGILSIDDLADPSKTEGFDMRVYMTSSPDTGLTMFSSEIIDSLNAQRQAINPSASLFYYNDTWNEEVSASVYSMLDNSSSYSEKFLVTWWTPWWGYEYYIANGQYKELSNGVTGSQYFGRINRGTTLSTPMFAKSGVIDSTTWNVLASIDVGNDAINYMDSYLHNHSSATIYDAFDIMMADPRYSYWYRDYRNMSTFLGAPTVCTSEK